MRWVNLLLFFLPLYVVADWKESEYVVKYSCYLTRETSSSFENLPHVGLQVFTNNNRVLFVETMGGWTEVNNPRSTSKSCSNWWLPKYQASIQDLVNAGNRRGEYHVGTNDCYNFLRRMLEAIGGDCPYGYTHIIGLTYDC